MNHPAQVGVVERVGDLGQEPAHLVHRLARGPGQQLAQMPAAHQRHHEIRDPVALAHVVDRDDVAMGQLRPGLRFAGEAHADRRIVRHLGRQHLDRHRPVQPEVPGPVDHRHPAPADLAFDVVLMSDRGGNPVAERIGLALVHAVP